MALFWSRLILVAIISAMVGVNIWSFGYSDFNASDTTRHWGWPILVVSSIFGISALSVLALTFLKLDNQNGKYLMRSDNAYLKLLDAFFKINGRLTICGLFWRTVLVGGICTVLLGMFAGIVAITVRTIMGAGFLNAVLHIMLYISGALTLGILICGVMLGLRVLLIRIGGEKLCESFARITLAVVGVCTMFLVLVLLPMAGMYKTGNYGTPEELVTAYLNGVAFYGVTGLGSLAGVGLLVLLGISVTQIFTPTLIGTIISGGFRTVKTGTCPIISVIAPKSPLPEPMSAIETFRTEAEQTPPQASCREKKRPSTPDY